jgi:hypothetical protein
MQVFSASDPVGIGSCIRGTAAAVSSQDKKQLRARGRLCTSGVFLAFLATWVCQL